MVTDEHIATSIRMAIDESGLTRNQIAESIGVSIQTISNWCTARYMISTEQAISLCNLLGITLDELIGRTEPKPPTGLELIAGVYARVNDDGKRTMEEHALMCGMNPRFSPEYNKSEDVSA